MVIRNEPGGRRFFAIAMAAALGFACRSRATSTRPLASVPNDSSERVYVPGDGHIHASVVAVQLPPADTGGIVAMRVSPDDPLLRDLNFSSPGVDPETLLVSVGLDGVADWAQGRPIDTSHYDFYETYYPVLRTLNRNYPSLFIVDKLEIDSGRTGFLIRAPGPQGTDAIDLWVFDRLANHFLAPLRLSDASGDEGRGTMLASWFVRGDSGLRVFQRRGAFGPVPGRLPSDSFWIALLGREGFETRSDSVSAAAARAFFTRPSTHRR